MTVKEPVAWIVSLKGNDYIPTSWDNLRMAVFFTRPPSSVTSFTTFIGMVSLSHVGFMQRLSPQSTSGELAISCRIHHVQCTEHESCVHEGEGRAKSFSLDSLSPTALNTIIIVLGALPVFLFACKGTPLVNLRQNICYEY